MIKKTPIALAALLLAIGTATLALTPTLALAETPPVATAKQESVRAEMGKPFTEIQTLITSKDYPQALTKLDAIEAFENKTPYELFAIARMRAVIASSMGDNEMLAKAFDSMIKSDFITAADKIKYTEGMAGTFYNEKKYDQSKQWTIRALALNKDSVAMRDLLARTMYLQNDYTGAITELNKQLQEDALANRVPTHEKLHLLISCYLKLKDNVGYASVLERMVEFYPKKEYWGDLLYRLPNKPGFSDRLRLDWYRLMLATDNMEEAAQYVEMTELALLAGLPTEAKKVTDAGYAANMLGAGKDAAKHKQLRDKVNKQAADDAKTLDAGETAAKAAKNGVGMVNMGYNYVTLGQAEKGIELIEQGIAKGGLKAPEEAKLHLGMAYLQAGNKAKATEVMKSLKATDGSADLGKLWLFVRKE
ncbi:tetratricopeptide repeat protein [Undibacterium sp. Ren11W]|uniref:tetratricopeptide repeat protein n=1 Tax=Undibacterium sp. Ren11W TaxID=3413045 RepID=UPI003BF0E661